MLDATGMNEIKAKLPYLVTTNSLLVLAALSVLYLPTLYDLFTGIWSDAEQMHGPLILVISIWLILRQWYSLTLSHHEPARGLGWFVLIIGLLLYALGRSQQIILFELGSFIFFIWSLMLFKFGVRVAKQLWFPLFFMVFMLPLPNLVVDMVTLPMKIAVSAVVEQLLYMLDYPISRAGVVLQLGQYYLLVANACAGLHTLLTLEAMGLLYLNLVHRDSLFRNVSMALLIIPISFTANVIRVLILSLVTYHFGDAAGQSYLHGMAGMVLFMSALMLIIGFDFLVQRIEASRRPKL
jgi:exosortase B